MADNVNHPAHYTGFSNGAEVIDITENLSFNLGNVVKYVARAGRKTSDPTEDLLKARFYLSREIERAQIHQTATTDLHDGLVDNLQKMLNSPRQWDRLDHVPPGVIVQDVDGDLYRRIQGTSKFVIAYQDDVHQQHYEWQDVPPFLYRDQEQYGPFMEVTDG